jgi:hypothetical protein
MEPLSKLKTFTHKLNFYNLKNPLDLSSIKEDYKDMNYLELSEASRQIETKMEAIKTQYKSNEGNKYRLHSLFLMNLYADIMEKVNSLIPLNYFDHIDVECNDPFDYPFGEKFLGIEYETYLQLIPLFSTQNEFSKEEFIAEMDKIIDPWWGKITSTGFLETENIEENRKIIITLLYDISSHKKLIMEICRYTQETRPNDRGLAFIKFLIVWLTEKKRILEDPNEEQRCIHGEAYSGTYCVECLKPQIQDHPSYKDCDMEECFICSIRDCPYECIEHYFHDGCPVCNDDENEKIE